jgi:hypothetical protein
MMLDNKKDVFKRATQWHKQERMVLGLGQELPHDEFIYVDHSYFNRGWEHGAIRLVRNAPHLTTLLDRPRDRADKFGVVLKEWRRNGSHIVIVEPSIHLRNLYWSPWIVDGAESILRRHTDRRIIKVTKEMGVKHYIPGAWAVVCPFSVAGVEAAIEGIPVFSTPNCPTWPISAGQLEQIETPRLVKNRQEWVNSLAYACWNVLDDMPTVKPYAYQ